MPWLVALGATILILAPMALSSAAPEARAFTYHVTITDLTSGQPLTPPLVVTHKGSGYLYSVGSAASPQLQQIAENGVLWPMQFRLQEDRVANANTDYTIALSSPGPTPPAPGPPSPLVPSNLPGFAVFPADSVTFAITARPGDRLSWVSMLVCTNDGFTGVDGLELPSAKGKPVSVETNAYDAGTETNTENAVDMVPPCSLLHGGPLVGTGATNPALAEGGVIHAHTGIQGGASLTVAQHGWTDPVARITIERVG